MDHTKDQTRLAGKKPIAIAPSCPNCGAGEMKEFYSVDNIPVHSCELVYTQQEAQDFPSGNLSLSLCSQCGFISNTRYDSSFRGYDVRYEETQGFSGTFNEFQVELVQRLIDRYKIRNKSVLEIGCGKGEFLCLLCEMGHNHGIGVDPTCTGRRVPDSSNNRVTFISEYYNEGHRGLKSDVICCRHTLEHIPDTQRFLQMVRKSIGQRRNVLVFFEVPDALRVFRENAFWDIYYEHCSYFTPGSLARLFRNSGFDIEELYLDYDDQYIMLTAWPSGHSTEQRLDIEDDLSTTCHTAAKFQSSAQKSISAWKHFITSHHCRGQRGIVWGSGSKGVAFLTTLGIANEIQYVVDINPFRQGRYMPGTGQRIIAPEELAGYKPDYVIVMNPIYEQEIRADLEKMRIAPQVHCV